MNEIYYIIFWWNDLVYTLRDDGGNTSLFYEAEAIQKVEELKANPEIQWVDKKIMEPCP
jgi:hypothetical protein